MKKIIINTITDWKIGKKTKNLRAKPLVSIMIEKSVMNKFLLDTIEGKEILGDGSLVCMGEASDVWQQMPKKFLQKYTVIDVDKDGWMVGEPRPDNAVNCVEVDDKAIEDGSGKFFIIAQWGEKTEEGIVQYGESGDYICQHREDTTDVWVVKKKIFLNTYVVFNG